MTESFIDRVIDQYETDDRFLDPSITKFVHYTSERKKSIFRQFKDDIGRELSTQAEMVLENSITAMEFVDRAVAQVQPGIWLRNQVSWRLA